MASDTAALKDPSVANGSNIINLLIIAEDSDGKQYKWGHTQPVTAPLLESAKAWGKMFNIPTEVIAFEDHRSKPLSMDSTPERLGYTAGSEVRIHACPTDANWADPRGDAVVQQGAGRGATTSEPQREPIAPAAVVSAPAAAVGAAASPVAATPAAKDSAGGSGIARAAKKAKGAAGTPAATAAPAAKAAAAPAAAGAGGSRKRAAPAPAAAGLAGIPDGAQISFSSTNPKKNGSKSWERYEKYKVAKTVAEALSLGAEPGDIKNDHEKGYLKQQPS